MERRDQFVVILGLVALLSASAVALPTQRAGKDEEPASPCDPILLAGMAASCVGNLVKPSEVCCEMVIASVGFGYGGTDPVPCLCRVVKEHEFMATGLSADMIVKMYRVCDGVLPVDPFMGHIRHQRGGDMAVPLSLAASPPWASSLPDDLVRTMASRLLAGDLLDYVRFRAVCHPWRSGTASPRGRGVVDPRFHPRRWMMLSEGHGLYPGHPKLHGYVRFFNLDTGAFVSVHIPLFEDHCVLDSFDGLLVLQRDHDTAIRLLHPFTGDILDLPPLSTLVPQMQQDLPGVPTRQKLPFLKSISTAATFSDDGGVVTVMLAFANIYRVAVATPRDSQWTMSTWLYSLGSPPFSCQGKTFVVSVTSKIFQIDTPLPGQVLQPPKLIATCSVDKLCRPIFFVECDSEILVIGYTDILCSKMLIYKLSDLLAQSYKHWYV
ncbi:hypothetical protein HU200_045159 [Digitaria exilis]|uniref:KIB1-4 beta-propeller domain-containing protein n=1 Tax=Digitaria exilis TaxID=1010633 RepID=A0A835B5X8_9POAL|nr:hypothetical protein HU200_045159 [Digitaria exilis]